MMYQLMNFDQVIREFEIDPMFGASNGMQSWIRNRMSANDRPGTRKLFSKYNLSDPRNFIELTHCLSLNDSKWIKSEMDKVKFEGINLYDNKFSEEISTVAFLGSGEFTPGLTPETTTHGALEKRWVIFPDNTIHLYKGGDLEPYAEFVSSELCKNIQIESFTEYAVKKYREFTVSDCKLFTTKFFGFRPASLYTTKDLRDIREVFAKYQTFWDMMLIDYLVVNTDRHLGNFGFIVNNVTEDIVDMAPIFDNGSSCLSHFDPGLYSKSEYVGGCQPMFGATFLNNMCSGIDINGVFTLHRSLIKKLELAARFQCNLCEFTQTAAKLIRNRANEALDFINQSATNVFNN